MRPISEILKMRIYQGILDNNKEPDKLTITHIEEQMLKEELNTGYEVLYDRHSIVKMFRGIPLEVKS